MERSDVKAALAVIATSDPEDADAARQTYRKGLAGHYVMAYGDRVVGVTGTEPIPDTEAAFWLSWCYLDGAAAPAELKGDDLLRWTVEHAREQGARKLFAEASQVDAPIGQSRRLGGARRMYEMFGFVVEAEHHDYYLPGEDLTVLSYRIAKRDGSPLIEEEERFILLIDADEIAETDDAYYIDWQYDESGTGSTVQEIRQWVDRIAGWEGRCAFVGIPSHASVAQGQLIEAGFEEDGRLTDLICDGIDEIRYRVNL
jgi:hypothetical protein